MPLPLTDASCLERCQNSFISFNTTPGKLLRVALIVGAVAGALLAHFYFGLDYRITIGIGLVPVPFLFIDGILAMCAKGDVPAKVKDRFSIKIRNPDEKLLDAVDQGDLKKFNEILESDFNRDIEREGAPLIVSLVLDRSVNIEITKAAINSRKFDLNVKSALNTNRTALELALMSRYVVDSSIAPVISLLLENGANVSLLTDNGFISFVYFLSKTADQQTSQSCITKIKNSEYGERCSTQFLIENSIKNHKTSNWEGFWLFVFEMLKERADFKEKANAYILSQTKEDGQLHDETKIACNALTTFLDKN